MTDETTPSSTTTSDFDITRDAEWSEGSNGCDCEFCSGKKRWDDNWCPSCGNNVLEKGKWWENLEVCNACEASNKSCG